MGRAVRRGGVTAGAMTPPAPDLDALRQQHDELAAQVRQLISDVGDLEVRLADRRASGSSTTSPAEDPDAEPADTDLLYPTLEDWVIGHFARVYVRPTGGPFRWCAQWWAHAEAITRLQALWRTWEALRVEPLGMDVWLRERLDWHLPQLLSATGPFASCTPTRHTATKDLVTVPAPTGWWDAAPQPPPGPPPAPGGPRGVPHPVPDAA